MPPAARITDFHTCPMVTPGVPPIPHVGGPIVGPCAPTVLTGSLPQAKLGDQCVCVGPPDVIVKGSATVLVMNMPAVRMGDTTAHGGVIALGLPTVMIGDSGSGGGGGGGAPKPAAGNGGGADIGQDGIAQFSGSLTTAGAFSNPEAQALVLQVAAEAGTPFCEQCGRA